MMKRVSLSHILHRSQRHQEASNGDTSKSCENCSDQVNSSNTTDNNLCRGGSATKERKLRKSTSKGGILQTIRKKISGKFEILHGGGLSDVAVSKGGLSTNSFCDSFSCSLSEESLGDGPNNGAQSHKVNRNTRSVHPAKRHYVRQASSSHDDLLTEAEETHRNSTGGIGEQASMMLKLLQMQQIGGSPMVPEAVSDSWTTSNSQLSANSTSDPHPTETRPVSPNHDVYGNANCVNSNAVVSLRDQENLTTETKRSLAEELFNLAKFGWYWGPISRSKAEEKLADQPDGAFLVRDSSDDKYLLSLSFRSYGKTLHTRIEHSNGWFSFYPHPELEGHMSLVGLIEHCVSHSSNGVFCYSRARAPGSPSFPVRFTKPISRFTQVRSLQYLCRFVIRQYTRVDHIEELPLPPRIKGYLEEGIFQEERSCKLSS
ncbi:uncharacterized protein LOC143039430 [Oratosquilla oratoria]|uniref:uncharacterized protein LOC143039430 n=1 Tax=Oratosquilla oratoria TaxID=337810 RepID=UPI003F763B6A